MALFRVGFAYRAMIRSKLSPMRGRISQIATSQEAERPTPLQMRRLFVISAVPFVAFGIVDQSVLLYAGDAIDNTLGVALGLPTLAAAAMGQVMSDTCGVAFGGTIEAAALKLGLPLPGLTEAQQRLGSVKRVSTLGGVCGVILGCFIGMGNLLLIDLKAAETRKEREGTCQDHEDHHGRWSCSFAL